MLPDYHCRQSILLRSSSISSQHPIRLRVVSAWFSWLCELLVDHGETTQTTYLEAPHHPGILLRSIYGGDSGRNTRYPCLYCLPSPFDQNW